MNMFHFTRLEVLRFTTKEYWFWLATARQLQREQMASILGDSRGGKPSRDIGDIYG